MLSGPIPDSITALKLLEVLDLHDNQFSAPLPIGFFGALSKLSVLRLNGNMLTGGIPEEIGLAKGLTQLYLSHNRMDGPLPKAFGSLTKLELIFLNSNKLVGELHPHIFAGTKSLEYLLLNRNQFCGEVPNSLLAIRNIQILRLDNNYLDPVSKERIPFTLKMGIQLGFKKIVLRPQHSGVAPYKIVPEYSEFPPDVLHPSDHAAAQRYRAATTATTTSTLETLYDLPDNPHRWTPAEVSFWARVHGASRSVCESIRELGMTGGQFFRLVEADLHSALGVADPRERAVLYSGMQRVLAVANGVLPPDYDNGDDENDIARRLQDHSSHIYNSADGATQDV
ncbi:hypothetical protein HDU84_006678 [Entophlyctis sp. JEL0112]|nr:hypothetical protein HDU84_006678 [Entophlyctis sp. JEL0112]